jgi:hypothetical protein
MNNFNDAKIKQDMIYLLGQLEAICFPIIGDSDNQGYYDLIDSIKEQYKNILIKTIGFQE